MPSELPMETLSASTTIATRQALDERTRGDLGSLAIACVQTENPMLLVRAARWRNLLTAVGVSLPWWLVHDIGLLFVAETTSIPIAPRKAAAALRRHESLERAHDRYHATLNEIAASEVLEEARHWRLSDEMVAVLLLRSLQPIFARFRDGRGMPRSVELPLDPIVYTGLEVDLESLLRAANRQADAAALVHIARASLRLIGAVERIDLDTLKLLGVLGAESSGAGAMQLLDLLTVFQSLEANDIVSFSLDLLPSVLETKRVSGAQTFSIGGYAGVTRSGTLDSLMLSELALDPDLFAQRYLEKELFYYAREKEREELHRLHYIVVDASASMRGKRAIFARGLALTLIKKLALGGEEVRFRFFDARLYDEQLARPGFKDLGGISIPYLLSFRGERGRNYAKVFGLLAEELARLKERSGTTPILYILTHAECHVPIETVERLREVAFVYGIYLLPSSLELDLEYADRLHRLQVVDDEALSERQKRTSRALAIVEDVTRGRTPHRP